MTDDLLKAYVAAGSAVVSTAIATAGAGLIAKFVTARLETQRHKLELYKSLYAERLLAGKAIMAQTSVLMVQVSNYLYYWDVLPEDKVKEKRDELEKIHDDLLIMCTANSWLLGREFETAMEELTDYLGEHVVASRKITNFKEIEDLYDEFNEKMWKLGMSLRPIVHSDDLTSMFIRPKRLQIFGRLRHKTKH